MENRDKEQGIEDQLNMMLIGWQSITNNTIDEQKEISFKVKHNTETNLFDISIAWFYADKDLLGEDVNPIFQTRDNTKSSKSINWSIKEDELMTKYVVKVFELIHDLKYIN